MRISEIYTMPNNNRFIRNSFFFSLRINSKNDFGNCNEERNPTNKCCCIDILEKVELDRCRK